MYHSAPAAYGMSSARLGLSIVLQPRFDAEDMLRLIDKHRVSVPTMFVRLLRLPAEVKKKYDLSSLRWITHGAAPCAPEVKREMIDWWGPMINEYYGATAVAGRGHRTLCRSRPRRILDSVQKPRQRRTAPTLASVPRFQGRICLVYRSRPERSR